MLIPVLLLIISIILYYTLKGNETFTFDLQFKSQSRGSTPIHTATMDSQFNLHQLSRTDYYIDNKRTERIDADTIANYHKTNELYIINRGKVHFLNNSDTSYTLNDLYPGIGNNNYYNSIYSIGNHTYFYQKNKCIKYNHVSNVVIENKDIQVELKHFDYAFVHYLDTVYGSDSPVVYFIKGDYFNRVLDGTILNEVPIKCKGNTFPEFNKVFQFNHLENVGLMGPEPTDRFKSTENITIKDSIQKYIIETPGKYRLEAHGAGMAKGGRGGRLFKDYSFDAGDILEILIGQSGTRLPCASHKHETDLPSANSCSGSGSTVIYLNGALLMVAGGGGGHTSEMVKPPPSCHSSFNQGDSNQGDSNRGDSNRGDSNGKLTIPIQELILHTKDFTVSSPGNIVRYDYIDNSIIKFKEPLTDYTIKLGGASHFTVKDHLNNEYPVTHFTKDTLTPETLLESYLGYTPLTLSDNEFCNTGGIVHPKLSINENAQAMKRFGAKKKVKGHIIVYGGFGGGGVSMSKAAGNIAHAGGGGGYLGGNSAVNSYETTPLLIPVASGGGGLSYVNGESINDSFIGNFNDSHGRVYLHRYTSVSGIAESPKFVAYTSSSSSSIVLKDSIVSLFTGKLSKPMNVLKIPLSSDPALTTTAVKIIFNSDGHYKLDEHLFVQMCFFNTTPNGLFKYTVFNSDRISDDIIPEHLRDTPLSQEHLNVSDEIHQVSLSKNPIQLTHQFKTKFNTPYLYISIQSPKVTNIEFKMVVVEFDNTKQFIEPEYLDTLLKKKI
jgi:hypothetical protein